MLSGLDDALRSNIATLKMRASQGELLVIDDLVMGAPDLPDSTRIFCLDGKISAGVGQTPYEGISPGLSFLWTNSGLEKFGSGERLKKKVSEFRQSGKHGKSVFGSATYLYTPNDTITLKIVKYLSSGVSLLAEHSLNALNKYQEPLDALSRNLISAVVASDGGFGLSDLAAFLRQETALEFGLLHLAQSPVRTITVPAATSTRASLKLLSQFLNLPNDIFSAERGAPPNPFPAIPLPQNSASELIVNAGLWGRPMADVIPQQRTTRILIIPIARPLGPRAGRDEQVTLAAPDLLFAFMKSMDRSQIDRIRDCVDAFSQHRFGARRFNLLAHIQHKGLGDPDEAPRLKPLDAITSASMMESILTPILNEILYTTSAHSVSVRVYDPQSQALVVMASASGSAGFSDVGAARQPIPIKNRVRISVVVFSFMNAGAGLPFVYLRKISPPIKREFRGRVKRSQRAAIPAQYRDLGLESPLITRSSTRSEICFPLMKGYLAFGTLNLEAPYPAAFDHDVDYLKLVKSGIEKLYDAADHKIDGRWIIASSARIDAVHQLWQYQEAGTFFSPEQNKALQMIFPARAEHGFMGSGKLSSLKSRTKEWVRQRWDGELCRLVLNMIKFDHLRDGEVDMYFLEASFVILRNLIQNSVKHSEPRLDLLFVDDRPWFGSRSTPCLRIYYRSSRSVPQDVIEKLGRSPIEQPIGSRVAYGMYNVGLLTRLLGGSLHVSSQGENARLTIEAHLPLPELQQ